ncbi:exodeoxyribonuclease VII large subunit [Clostridium taeniosporum]|uniref:Exodeoxyribonuclease 7 large subunit n=1 Tax=Clostridium taeniosporum TaxID=394958 RepID=A0A1D7XKU6_9CLOT|nr:exodeoxyribonuclease VII large subunit [Clostridium taeniosporum]AOR23907.1 exodeoxyribonuclease VII large subunit [Clostridium taeniosporum]
MKIKTLTVSDLTSYIKKIIDNDFILNNLSVKGEISNLKFHSSGHIYFSLKDSNSKVNCVMFKGKASLLNIALEDGMEVIVKGRASIYTAAGSFQLYCDEIKKEGQGELFIKFEALKEKLSKAGYFDEIYKKSIPMYAKKIGVVTSSTGAVIRDIINVTKRRNSLVDIVLYPAKVQGDGAYKEIIEGIEYFNNKQDIDLIIIGRGGGSIEELWNFNEEELAEVIFNSKLPIISAVGHEVDFTISDFVSDIRAATPSQAAEIAVPLLSDINTRIYDISKTLDSEIQRKLRECKDKLEANKRLLKLHSPMTRIVNSYIEVDKLKDRLYFAIDTKIKREKQKIESLNSLLSANNPIKVLNKGYAIIEDENQEIIKETSRLKDQKEIRISLSDGKVKGNFIPIK